MSANYTTYHLHSDYSLLDSCTNFKEYIDAAVQNGQKAIAFTEHGKPMGWVSKKLYCDQVGIQFIHGVEIYLTESLLNQDGEKVRDNYHTVLLAKNWDGVLELNDLVSRSCQEDHFYYVNRISFDEFLSLSNNILSTSACLASPLNKLPIDHPRYLELAEKYDYLEIQPHAHPDQVAFNRRLLDLSRRLGKPLIAGTDTHSLSPYKAECRSILMKAKHKSYGDEDSFDLTYKTYDQLVDAFRRQGALPEAVFLEAIENTNRMAASCEPFQLDTSIKYPILYGSREADAEKFTETVQRKFQDKLSSGVIPPEQESAFLSAIQEEMRVFRKLHMDGFMLSMSELISWCKEQGMAIGTARGSVGGSRVAYVTDIIDLNPETWHTVFSRFCNEDRVEIGDIDIDCVESDRPAIFQHIIHRFGADKTARVASFGTIKSKGVIDDVGRALDLQWKQDHPNEDSPYSLKNIDHIKKEFDADEEGTKRKYPDLFYYYDGLLGAKVSQSVHPAGMVISPIHLPSNYGVFNKDGEQCLMLDMDEAHEVGVAKYDFLVLKTVQVIRDTCRYLGRPYPKTHEINWDDQAVWADMVKSPIGIFQMESAFAFDSLKKFQPKSIFDMSLVTAAIRPSGASYREDLLAHKQHHNPSPIIDELLSDNLGLIVYQEDTLKFLQQICGLSGSEADNIRRAIGRKQKDRLEAAMPSILEGYCAKSNQPREIAEEEAKEFLQVIEDSASYQFGYNHSIAYCLLGYLCAYFRYYHPIEFITAFLNDAANDEDIRNGTILAKQRGITIVPPKFGISRSDYFFTKEKRVIAKGLSSVKYMGKAVVDELYALSKRQYATFTDLLWTLSHHSSLDSRQLDILIKIDFFSDFGNQRELFQIVSLFDLFKKGEAKQLKKERAAALGIEDIVAKYANGTTKSGKESKSYTLLFPMTILRECEQRILSLGMEDLGVLMKSRNFKDIMGYAGYISGKEEDRNKLYIKEVYPVRRKKDNVIFGYSLVTQSIGSGKESRMTVFKKAYDADPVKPDDILVCKSWERDGKYFRMLRYDHLYA